MQTWNAVKVHLVVMIRYLDLDLGIEVIMVKQNGLCSIRSNREENTKGQQSCRETFNRRWF
jgi:hypothetical protein